MSDSQTITIKTGDVSRIIKGLTSLAALNIPDFPTNLGITKSIENLSKAERAYMISIVGLGKKYAKKNEKGLPITKQEGGMNFYEFDNATDAEAFQKEKQAIDDQKVLEKVWPIKTSVLKSVKAEGLASMMSFCHELIEDDAKVLE